MTVTQAAAALDVAVIAASVAFLMLVAVKALHSPTAWLAWPPRSLIVVAAAAGVCYVARFFLRPADPIVMVAGCSWLLMAAGLTWTRWWLYRQLRRRLEHLTAPPTLRNGGEG